MRKYNVFIVIVFLVFCANAYADTMSAKAKQISTTTTSFNGKLSSADDTVQKALDTLDNIVIPTTPFDLSSDLTVKNTLSTSHLPTAAVSSGDTTHIPTCDGVATAVAAKQDTLTPTGATAGTYNWGSVNSIGLVTSANDVAGIGGAADTWQDSGSYRELSPTGTTDDVWLGAGQNLSIKDNLIVTSGNVGVGTPSPTQKFEVTGNAQINGDLTLSNPSPTVTLYSATHAVPALVFMRAGAAYYDYMIKDDSGYLQFLYSADDGGAWSTIFQFEDGTFTFNVLTDWQLGTTLTQSGGKAYYKGVEIGTAGGGTWGSITGTLANQTDLNTALNARINKAAPAIDISNDTTVTGILAATHLPAAAADGSTKGAATFTASDFDATGGVVSLDYTNGQAASSGAKGFLTAADWSTFNGKLSSYTETDPIVKAINGIVKSNGSTISAASAGTDYLAPAGTLTGLVQTTTAGDNYFAGSGNLGIGTSSPTSKVAISGDVTAHGSLSVVDAFLTSATTYRVLATDKNKKIIPLTATDVLRTSLDSTSGTDAAVFATGPTLNFATINKSLADSLTITNDLTVGNINTYNGTWTIENSGNVGIGTSSPTERLQVVGNASIDGTLTIGNITSASYINMMKSVYIGSDCTVIGDLYVSNLIFDSQVDFDNINNLSADSVVSADLTLINQVSPTGVVYFSVMDSAGHIGKSALAYPAADGAGSGGTVGPGTQNKIAKFATTTTVGDSVMYDNGTNVGIGTTAPGYTFDVIGSVRASVDISIANDLITKNSSVTGAAYFLGDTIRTANSNFYIENGSGITLLSLIGGELSPSGNVVTPAKFFFDNNTANNELNYPTASYAAGTAYTLTATAAKIDFGTTDPGITLPVAGTYMLYASVSLSASGFNNEGADLPIELKIRRTTATAADISNTPITVYLSDHVSTTGCRVALPVVEYTTTAASVAIELQGRCVGSTPKAGTPIVDDAEIVAIRTRE